MWSIISPDGQAVSLAALSVQLEHSTARAAVPPAMPELGELPPAPVLTLHLHSRTRHSDLPALRRRLLALLNPAQASDTPARVQYGLGDTAVELAVRYAGGLDDLPPDHTLTIQLVPDAQAWHSTANTTQSIVCASRIASAAYLLEQTPDGVWQSSSSLNGAVNALLVLPDGTHLIGGEFSGYVRQRSHVAGAWQTLAGLNGAVTCLAVLGDGRIVAGGSFTAPASALAMWDGSAWQSLGMPPFLPLALAVSYSGTLYVGGLDLGAGSSVLAWDGSVWQPLGAGLGGAVHALLLDQNDTLYAGGNFVGGVAYWQLGAWATLGGGVARMPASAPPTVYALAGGPDGSIYAGGDFALAGGGVAPNLARWTGYSWEPLGLGVSGTVRCLAVAAALKGNGVLLWAGGAFTAAGGRTLPARLASWNGAEWLPVPIRLHPSVAPQVLALAQLPDGTRLVGYGGSGLAHVPMISTITNHGTAPAYPVLTLAGAGQVQQLANLRTGATITFANLSLHANEQLTLDLRPATRGLRSSLRGVLSGALVPGSDLGAWCLLPGENRIALFADQPSATLAWQSRYWSYADVE